MTFKGIFFDLDGTLINSIDDIADSVNIALKDNGFPIHGREKYFKFVGNGMKKLVERALPLDVPKETILAVYEQVKTEYSKRWNKKTAPYPKIDNLLKELQRKNIIIGILSNKPHDFTEQVVKHYFSEFDFAFVQGAEEPFPHKPDPKLALHIVKKLKLYSQEIIYVGDSDVDMQTAVNANFYPVGVSWGFRSKEELWENGAKFVVDDPMEILALLDK
ncbi:phosphoglycolate phosphatase [Anaerobranca californiensis DSM 14826]|jgi:phosphoglycolate phosphatase|uniref:Phosphoglycolate phosphatase n=1 Tax=Anaerobranca californiensis DSM 14826 TaxID=1120989 RepID=A0A1M6LEM5_9FIRM|nr:HAD family hydrolase [Anaerobranca californiensis]SHJ69654.1 phosphoglycolate phosphatase [Anaerobranca californiensis DSM 14826]